MVWGYLTCVATCRECGNVCAACGGKALEMIQVVRPVPTAAEGGEGVASGATIVAGAKDVGVVGAKPM